MEVVVFSSVASAVGFGLLGSIWFQVSRLNKQLAQNAAGSERAAELIVDDLSARLNLTDSTDLDRISKSVEEMREDVSWMVSERMIEQAIEIARTEPANKSMCSLGMSDDEVTAAAIFRKH